MDLDCLKDSEIINENYSSFFVNLFCCGHNFWDLLLFSKEDLTKDKDSDYYEVVHPALKWPFFLYEGLTKEIANQIKTKINKSCQSEVEKNKYNIVLCKLDENIEESCGLLISETSQVSPTVPVVVFVVNGTETEATIRDYIRKRKIKVDPRDIFTVSSPNNNPTELYRRLFKICCYYNQLGDDYVFPVQLSKDERVFHYVNTQFLFTFNIMLIGNPSCGKSTFTNQIMGEKRSLERTGTFATRHITQYKHAEYPIVIYDTPGFQTLEDRNEIIKVITSFKTDLKSNKEEIHLILYFINGSGRAYKGDEVDFLKKLSLMSTPLWFVITFCDTPKKCSDRQKSVEDDFRTKIEIDNPVVLTINNTKPIIGYKRLFEEMHDLCQSNCQNAETIKSLKVEKKIGFIIGAALRVGHFLEVFTSREIAYYFLLASMSLFDYCSESKVKMMRYICGYYLIDKSLEECEELMESFHWKLIVKEFAKEIEMKKNDNLALDVHWAYKTVTIYDKTGMINEKIFRYIYLKAVPYLAVLIKDKPTSFQLMTLNVISLCIVACKTNSSCSQEIIESKSIEEIIEEDIDYSIHSLKTISELPKFQDPKSKEKA